MQTTIQTSQVELDTLTNEITKLKSFIEKVKTLKNPGKAIEAAKAAIQTFENIELELSEAAKTDSFENVSTQSTNVGELQRISETKNNTPQDWLKSFKTAKENFEANIDVINCNIAITIKEINTIRNKLIIKEIQNQEIQNQEIQNQEIQNQEIIEEIKKLQDIKKSLTQMKVAPTQNIANTKNIIQPSTEKGNNEETDFGDIYNQKSSFSADNPMIKLEDIIQKAHEELEKANSLLVPVAASDEQLEQQLEQQLKQSLETLNKKITNSHNEAAYNALKPEKNDSTGTIIKEIKSKKDFFSYTYNAKVLLFAHLKTIKDKDKKDLILGKKRLVVTFDTKSITKDHKYFIGQQIQECIKAGIALPPRFEHEYKKNKRNLNLKEIGLENTMDMYLMSLTKGEPNLDNKKNIIEKIATIIHPPTLSVSSSPNALQSDTIITPNDTQFALVQDFIQDAYKNSPKEKHEDKLQDIASMLGKNITSRFTGYKKDIASIIEGTSTGQEKIVREISELMAKRSQIMVEYISPKVELSDNNARKIQPT